MKTNRMLFLIGGLTAIVSAMPLALGADLQPIVAANLTGELHVEQGIPCGGVAEATTPVAQGRLEITPVEGVGVPGGGTRFTLARVSVAFEPLSLHGSCLGVGETRQYTELGVQLEKAVSFTAVSSGPDVFDFTIPKGNFLVYEGAMLGDDLENGYKYPSEDVTGTIDLAHATVTMRVVLATRVQFKAGCLPPFGCIINETDNGTLTATLGGALTFPDSDGDGVPDRVDNCRFFSNVDQARVATPVVRPPSDVTLSSCLDTRIGAAIAVDLCDAGLVMVTSDATATFKAGSNLVTWRGQDATGRLGYGTQTVSVVDKTPPAFTLVPPAIALNDCKAPALGPATAADDCDGALTVTNNAPKTFAVGSTAVTWTATDVAGNLTKATQIVTVTDMVSPTVSCVQSGRVPRTFKVASSDACTKTPTISLGSFVLANGEMIRISETDEPGVRLLNVVGPNQIKHFKVGKGEAVIVATDGSGNVASAYCR